MLPAKKQAAGGFIFMATTNGTVKKTPVEQFSRPRSNGLIAINLDAGNELVRADYTDGQRYIMLFSSEGMVLRFKETDVRATGRTARGVIGIRMPQGQHLVACIVVSEDVEATEGASILNVSERGYGKRSPVTGVPRPPPGRGAASSVCA